MASKTDARGITTTYGYNSIHKRTSQTYSDSTPSVSFQYDTAGRRTQTTDTLGTVTYSYVPNTDRLQQEQRTLTGITGTFTTSYVYIKGDVTQMTYPSGRVVNFNYATGGGCCNSRLSSVVDQTTGTTVASSLAFNAAGGLTSRTLGNSVVETFGYNNRLQETAISATLTGTTLMDFTYNYGSSSTNTGRVLSRTDGVQPEHSVAYTYDSIYRLSQVASNGPSASWSIGWTFDVWGNRLTQTPQGVATSKVGTQTTGYTNNRINGNTYDAVGNQTNDGLHNYAFNAETQITQMDAGAATYAYDGEGRRMKKVTSTETTYTFYGPGGIISEFTTSNAIATATTASSTDKCFYHTTDKLGSAVLVMNASGVVIENNRTLPYGEAWLTDAASTNDKKFTTYQRDTESGLDYAMDRYLANTNGRFLSPDKGQLTLYLPVSLNRYVYTFNDPINFTDRTGNEAEYVLRITVTGAAPRTGPTPPPLSPAAAEALEAMQRNGRRPDVQGSETRNRVGGTTEPPPCDPGWITENMTDPDAREFTPEELNFAARGIYGEASGGGPAEERNAIASVIYNRLGARGYPGGVQTTLTGVLTAGGSGGSAQFRGVTVPTENGKFRRSGDPGYQSLNVAECNDLTASVNAVRSLMNNGPAYNYTSFRGGTVGPGTVIGGSRFGYGNTFQ